MSNPSHSASFERASALAADLRTFSTRLKRRLREHGGQHDLTPSQVSVVLRLEKDGPSTISNLARAEGMRPQSMSTLVAALHGARLVRGTPDPTDGRQTLMSLTKTCQKFLLEGRTARQDWLTARIHERLSVREQATLATALPLLARLVED